jgi:hypothetical protein
MFYSMKLHKEPCWNNLKVLLTHKLGRPDKTKAEA